MEVECDVKENEDFYQVGTEQIRIGNQQRVKNKYIATFAVVMDIKVE